MITEQKEGENELERKKRLKSAIASKIANENYSI